MTVIVTYAARFIGSNFILNCLSEKNEKVIGFDKLSYAGNLGNLKSVEKNSNYEFVQGGIGTFETGISKTNQRYLDNQESVDHLQSRKCEEFEV